MKFKDELNIDDTFPDEQALAAFKDLTPQFINLTNYLVSDMVPQELSFKE